MKLRFNTSLTGSKDRNIRYGGGRGSTQQKRSTVEDSAPRKRGFTVVAEGGGAFTGLQMGSRGELVRLDGTRPLKPDR